MKDVKLALPNIFMILLLVFYSFTNLENTTEYSKGYEAGYKAGWCYEIIGCVEPIPPVTPVPTVDCPKGYKCGYNRGFAEGLNDRKE